MPKTQKTPSVGARRAGETSRRREVVRWLCFTHGTWNSKGGVSPPLKCLLRHPRVTGDRGAIHPPSPAQSARSDSRWHRPVPACRAGAGCELSCQSPLPALSAGDKLLRHGLAHSPEWVTSRYGSSRHSRSTCASWQASNSSCVHRSTRSWGGLGSALSPWGRCVLCSAARPVATLCLSARL
jgi:hypothetical protein